jgi:hypothetical protein
VYRKYEEALGKRGVTRCGFLAAGFGLGEGLGNGILVDGVAQVGQDVLRGELCDGGNQE